MTDDRFIPYGGHLNTDPETIIDSIETYPAPEQNQPVPEEVIQFIDR